MTILPHTNYMNKTDAPLKTSPNRIIIVEDDADFRESLIKYLKLNGYDITGVGSAMEFYQHLATQQYALAIIDLGLPDQNGLVLTEYLKINTDIRIIILTARANLEDKIAGYDSGADIYLLKNVDFREIMASIASVLRRFDVDFPNAQKYSEADLVAKEQKPRQWKLVRGEWLLLTPDGQKIRLTSKEFDFLMVLSSSQQQVIARDEILKALDYPDNELRGGALEALVHRLRRKTAICNDDSPIKTTHGVGYCFTADILVV